MLIGCESSVEKDFRINRFKGARDKEAASCPTMAAEQSPYDNMADGRTNLSDRSIKEAMDNEAASCQTMAAEQSFEPRQSQRGSGGG